MALAEAMALERIPLVVEEGSHKSTTAHEGPPPDTKPEDQARHSQVAFRRLE